MITRVRLRNWKSHLESEFDFSGGVNAIIGIMGSGKTSIMQAISFGLYGSFPALQARRLGLDDVVMKKPRPMEEAEVSIWFSVQGKRYTVTRAVRKGKGTVKAELRQGRRLVEATAQGVTREVSRLLDMDYELFSRAVYSEQNAMDYFLRIPKGQRMEHIDRMLRLDRFERVRESAVSITNRIRQRREEKLRMVSEMRRERLPERIGSLREELEGLQGSMGGLETGLEEAGRRASRLEKEVSGMERQERELSEVSSGIEGAESGIAQVEETLRDRMKAMEGVDRAGLRSRKASLEKALKETEEGIAAARKSLEQGRERMASLNAEIRVATEQIQGIHRLGDRCPLCESGITDSKRRELVDTRKIREERLREEASKVASELEGSRRSLEEMEGILRERIEERERLRAMEKDLEARSGLEARKAELVKRRDGLLERRARLERELEGVDLEARRKDLVKASGEERELRARLEALRQRISDREEMLRELRSREETLVRLREETRMDQESMESLGKFTGAVKLTQGQLREEFVKAVNSTMARVWEEVYPYGDFTGIRLGIERDYVLQLREKGGTWVSVEGIASGGERSLAALALRVAFSMAFIPNLKWLILDEPTHNLDANAIENLTDALREGIGRFAEQVFLITHDERVSEGVGGNLYRLERDKGQDGPTRTVGIGDLMGG